MLGKKNRYSFRKGVPKYTVATPFFVLRYQQLKTSPFTCAVVVGKKVDKSAVKRNSIKRKMVAEVQKIMEDNSTPHEMVLYARKDILKLEKEQIFEELNKAFTAAHIL